MKLSTFALSAVSLMVRYITQIAADQASDASSDALDLIIIAKAFPYLQTIEGLFLRELLPHNSCLIFTKLNCHYSDRAF